METGMGCSDGTPTAPYALNEFINTTTAANGLNPLPNGSLTLAWSASTANVSGFGGYDSPGPHYDFVGPGYSPNPGNEQVYWGFLRDGVNFDQVLPTGTITNPVTIRRYHGIEKRLHQYAVCGSIGGLLGLDAVPDQRVHH